jgi:exodeoxyribonuclease V alpha subunit
MAKLLDALPAEARLVLVGDKDQLASVEAGAVLGDICGRRPAALFSPAMGARIRELTGHAVPTGDPGATIGECIVELTSSRRFAAGSAIGELSRAVNRGSDAQALEILSQPGDDSVDRANGDGSAAIAPVILSGYRALADRGSPAALLDRLNRFRVLCAHREGRLGAGGVNRLTERLLAQAQRIRIDPRRDSPWYAGRPVLITRNDYGLGLFNGDAGITLPDPGADTGELYVYFADPGGGLRRFLPYRLPAHETVFAMTVHKSQGSEFDRVLLVLPERDSPVLTRELIYTALTRARHRITLAGDPSLLAAAIRRPVERASGLCEALWGLG